MNSIVVQTTCQVRADSPAARSALPPGFPFLVERTTGRIIEPALLFLVDAHLKVSGRWVANSALAAANDLKDWWGFLDFLDLAWDQTDSEYICQYRDAMFATLSPTTHKPYTVATVRRRVGTVLSFYRWAGHSGLLERTIDDASVKRSGVSIDQHMLAHLGRSQRKRSAILPSDDSGADDKIRPLSDKTYRLVAQAIGPLPSQQNVDPRSCRDRLGCEIALHTGLRVDEVAHLTIRQFQAMVAISDEKYSSFPLRISHTKGSRPRTVLFPGWLLLEIHAYIDGERRRCIDAARRHWLRRDRDQPENLFLNREDAGRHVGRPMRKGSLQDAFRKAVRTAGATSIVRKVDPETGEAYATEEAAHSFHDLRHTFAVWLYTSLKRQGNAEPWKLIQSLLGHRQLTTTMNIYLRFASVCASAVSDEMADFFQGHAR